MIIEIDDGDVGARLGERDGDGTSDAAVAARDQRYLCPDLAGGASIARLAALIRERTLAPRELSPICHSVRHAFSLHDDAGSPAKSHFPPLGRVDSSGARRRRDGEHHQRAISAR